MVWFLPSVHLVLHQVLPPNCWPYTGTLFVPCGQFAPSRARDCIDLDSFCLEQSSHVLFPHHNHCLPESSLTSPVVGLPSISFIAVVYAGLWCSVRTLSVLVMTCCSLMEVSLPGLGHYGVPSIWYMVGSQKYMSNPNI